MTELQMGLIGLGAIAVVGVLGYNKWQESRHRKLAESLLKPAHDDVLLGTAANAEGASPAVSERSEPEIRITPAPARGTDRVEPVMPADEAVPEADDELAEMPVLQAEEMPESAEVDLPVTLLDPRVEFIVAMELVDPVAVVQILHSQRDVLQKLSKPVHWVGFKDATREWVRLQSDDNFDVRRLRVGLQLANRLGPVSDGDLVIFAGAMQALADELMAVADMPSIRVRDQATEIDRFCAEVDLEIGVNLVSKGVPFSGTKIRALAEAAGMVLGADGLFTRYDESNRALFYLQNLESAQFSPETIRTMTSHGLTFLLDVPRVDHGERVFGQMVELAKRFGDTLQGMLVDDNRQPLTDIQLEHIRREFIAKPQGAMAAYQLAAGSPQALRLFS
ncbi:MAG: cell division protein ZipA C-terminal FtsZ-binding domain-containing protein [Rhodocyclaceae bacterium]|nr:cell division protein ZipA C-terminal FtsZ-binding domain-containing protein [Rhodocyclaceae bacterium]